MKKRNPLFFSSALILSVILLFTSCKKINEATELGAELIPAVDNINTFADTLAVETFTEQFINANDTLRVDEGDIQYLGHISNDPFFGKTTASMFLELKPTSYPYTFPENDAIAIDSIVLVLKYFDLYGDSTIPQRVNVHEITSELRVDSPYRLRANPITYNNNPLGSKTFLPKDLNDSIKGFREQAANQLRIPLNNSFGQRLLNRNGTNDFISDSAFKKFFRGFAIIPERTGNAVMGFNLIDTNTKLAIYFKYSKSGKDSTLVRNFNFNLSNSVSANKVEREYTGTPVGSAIGNGADQIGYIQNTPGTYIRVKVPGLAALSNRVIHRAELIVQQLYDPSDAIFTPSPFLFIDALKPDNDLNPDNDIYKGIPYDLSINSSTGDIDAGLGTNAIKSFSGQNSINIWRLNVSRYIQNVVNKKEAATDFRLTSTYKPSFIYEPFSATALVFPQLNSTTTKYRVRVGGGNHPTQRMLMRVVYSNLP